MRLKWKTFCIVFIFVGTILADFVTNSVPGEYSIPGSSYDDITILTPVDQTYSKPMYGLYPGSNSFDNDAIGSEPAWFQNINSSGGTVQVIDSLEEHKTVLELHDTSTENATQVMRTLLSLPVNGTIEYWMRTDDASKLSGFNLHGGIITAELIKIRVFEYKFQYYNGSSWKNITDAESNKWHHVRIDFECTPGNYSGLAQHQWKIFVDGGHPLGVYDFLSTKAFASFARWNTDWIIGNYNYKYYLDAIGFSWNHGYTEIDNMNEGYYLEFLCPNNLTWMGYSLDGDDVVSILGNITIPNPGDGVHTIRVYGNDSLDNTYSSGLRFFEINNPSLVCLPGMGGGNEDFGNNYKEDKYFAKYYGIANIHGIPYYQNTSVEPEFSEITANSSILEMGAAIKDFILRRHQEGYIKSRIDLVGISQGSVVSRSIIKQHYYDLKCQGIEIIHFASFAGPNHGNWAFTIGYWNNEANGTLQVNEAKFQMATVSNFMQDLNSGDETPFGVYYNTYVGFLTFFGVPLVDIWYQAMEERIDDGIGGHYNETLIEEVTDLIGLMFDGAVDTKSTYLEGALNNRIYEGVGHTGSVRVFKDMIWDFKSYPKSELYCSYPQNQTYYEPLEGYYVSSSGFESDLDGYRPRWFEEIGRDGGTVKVRNEIGGHKKVVDIYDTSIGLKNAHARKILEENQSYGTIEYWMRSNDASKLCGFRLDDGSIANEMITLRTYYNFLQYYNGTGWNTIQFVQNNTWYHIRIDFECTDGNYMGLSQYRWRLYVNSSSYGDFLLINNRDSANKITWYNDYLHLMWNYHYYIDAIGLSWDPKYTIGDNLNEGLFIGMNLDFPEKWINYSLDSSDGISILGNTTIPMPSNGPHSITLIAQNIWGETIESSLRYFSVDTEYPIIDVEIPDENILYGVNPPSFELTITEPNIDLKWYTINDSSILYYFTGESGTISQGAWNEAGNGTVIIQFYASDLGGHESIVEVTVRKDIIPPTITVSSPDDEEIFEDPPNFICTASDPNGVASKWYTLDNGITNVTFSGNEGQIDAELWNTLPDGTVLIKFYAEDSVGNIGYDSVQVIKQTESQPRIHGFNIALLITVICVASIVFIFKFKATNHS